MKRFALLCALCLIALSSLNAQRDTTSRMLSFSANTVYFLNGLLLNTGDDDLKDLSRRWYKQCNISEPPTGSTVITVHTDAETVYRLSAVIRQFPMRLIASQWNEISNGINNAAAGHQPLVTKLAELDTNDSNDRASIRQAGKKDAQGKL